MATERLGKELLNHHGFKLKKGGLGGGFGFYNHSFDNRSLFIGCSIAKYGEKSIVGHIGGSIIFKEIEYLLIPLLVKNKLMSESADEKTSTTISINDIPSLKDVDFSKYSEDIVIYDETGVSVLVERMKVFYQEIAAPAFESFISIEQLVPIMQSKSVIEISQIFHFGLFTKAIIYRLCNLPDYNTFINERIDAFEKAMTSGDKDIDTLKWYNTLIELKEILDNTEPKYNL